MPDDRSARVSAINLLRLRGSELAALVVVAAMSAVQYFCFVVTANYEDAATATRQRIADMRMNQEALVDAEEGVRDLVFGGSSSDLPRHYAALKVLEAEPHIVRDLPDPNQDGGTDARATVASSYRDLLASWERSIGLARHGREEEARHLSEQQVNSLNHIRSALREDLQRKQQEAGRIDEQVALLDRADVALQIGGAVLALLLLLRAFRSNRRESDERRDAIAQSESARSQLSKLFQMTDMLQSAMSYADANAVLHATAHGLLPEFGCALFVFNNSRDRLELSTAWNLPSDYEVADHIVPEDCWALKRGKCHVNGASPGALICEHHRPSTCTSVEIPMIARGEVFGLLNFALPATANAAHDMIEIQRIATSIAEGMSLALANIALREKLRNQALRDPLTGLYNRRYMEEMLERFSALCSRSMRPLAVMMVDLDNFKILNDQHGHGKGDSVLREVAAIIRGGIRHCDIACRYGGEEMLILLPESGLDDAQRLAEMLRARIESLSEDRGARVTASFGIAAIPQSTSSMEELVSLADAALYRAKELGRNRVAVAHAPAVETACISVAAE